MSDTAAHLVERVFPRVPVRQWVLSLPHALRFLIAKSKPLCRAVRKIRLELGRRDLESLVLISSFSRSMMKQCPSVADVARVQPAT